ncbi:MAG: alginate export family protein, partial [Mucilaginibacter sp.]|nr:alginate export family protein [Mucilaginibacter sp.]
GRLNTFDPLFPKGAYFGLVSIIGPSNLADFHPYVSLALSKRLIFTTDYDFFYRMSRNDGIYGPNAILIYSGKNARSSDIGKQLQTQLEYNVNKFLYLRADFTWFKAGEYLKEVGPGKDILVASSTIQFKF